MDIGEVLTRAGKIFWKYKFLWLFGALVGVGQGQSLNSIINLVNVVTILGEDRVDLFPGLFRLIARVPEEAHIFILIGVILLALALGALAFSIGAFGQVGVIQGTALADAEDETLRLSQVFAASKPHYLRMLGMIFFLFLVSLVLGVMTVVVFFIFHFLTFGVGTLCLMPVIFVVIFLGSAMLGAFIKLSMAALVIGNLSIWAAFQRGWMVLKTNLWLVVSMALILGVMVSMTNLLFNITILGTLFGMLALAMAESLSNAIAWVRVGLILTLLYLPVLVILQGVMLAYLDAGWTLTFLRLSAEDAVVDTDAPPELQDLPA